MARTRDEAKAALAAAQKWGDYPTEKLKDLTDDERKEFGVELARFWGSGSDDQSRDEAQRNYLLQLATEAGQ